MFFAMDLSKPSMQLTKEERGQLFIKFAYKLAGETSEKALLDSTFEFIYQNFDCFLQAIIDKKVEGNHLMVYPETIQEYPGWEEIAEAFANKPDAVLFLHNQNGYYYRFGLQAGESLLLGVNKKLDEAQVETLELIFDYLGQNLSAYQSTQMELHKREKMLLAISNATEELLSNPDIYQAISNCLDILGPAVGVDRTYFFENSSHDRAEMLTSQRYEWNADDTEPQIDNPELQNIPISIFEDFLETVLKNKPFNQLIKTLPAESDLRAILESQNIKSILIIPIFYQDKFWGFVGYDDCKMERSWTEAEISLLRTFSKSITTAIERADQADQIYNMALFPLENPFPVVRIDLQGNILMQNDAAKQFRYFNFNNQKFTHQEFLTMVATRVTENQPTLEFEVEASSSTLLIVARRSDSGNHINLYTNDISKQKETEKKLARLSLVAEANQDGVVFTDSKGKITWINEKFLEMVGLGRKELLGKSILEVFNGIEANKKVLRKVKTAYQTCKNEDLEIILTNKKDLNFWVNIKIHPLANNQGEVNEFFAEIENIDGKKQAEEKMKTSESRLSTLITNFQSGILFENENREIIITNVEFCKKFRIPAKPEQLVGADCSNSANDSKHLFADPELFVERIDVILDEKRLVIGEEIEMADGSWLTRDYIPVFIDRIYKGHLWVYNDVTRRKLANIKLQQQEEKYRGILENMELGLMEVDNDETIIRAYEWFCDMVGYTEEELLGKNAMELFIPPEYHEFFKEETQKRSQGQAGIYELELVKKNGSRIWALISGAPIYDANRKKIGSLGIHYDITKQKKLQSDLLQAKHDAENARESEKKFLSNMSHEIRNPINAVVGMTNLLYDTPLNEVQLDYLDTIKYASEILLSLISDVLDINKIEAGQLNYEESEVDLVKLVNSLTKTFSFKSQNQMLEIKSDVLGSFDHFVLSDKTFISQILMNLVGNAVKFTERGFVVLGLKLLEDSSEGYLVEFKIMDTGIGIDKDKLASVFESFRQADNQIKLKYGGTGLGLSITRELVQRLGGEISVESEMGQGSTFILSFKFRKGSRIADQKMVPVDQDQVVQMFGKILAVEDSKLNQNYLGSLLTKFGVDYKIASNGVEALEILNKEVFDLILMDIRMPVMDGYEATIHIRGLKNDNAKVPIIALTASALLDEREKALNAGMNHHLTKPYTESQLLSAIKDIAGLEINYSASKVSSDEIYLFPDCFDVRQMEEYYGDNAEYISRIFEDFINYVLPELEKSTVLFETGKLDALKGLVHKIKPNFLMVGLPQLSDICARLEETLEYKGQNQAAQVNSLFGEFQVKTESFMPLVIKEKNRLVKLRGEL